MCTYRVERNDVFGRYIVASRNLKAGELIIAEKAMMVGPQINAFPICFRCCVMLHRRNTIACKDCEAAVLCSSECEGTWHCAQECEALKSRKLKPEHFLKNPQIIMPLRCILVGTYDEEKWDAFMQLEPHLEQRRDSYIWRMHKSQTEDVLKALEFGVDFCDDFVQRVCGILDVNSFELRPKNCEGAIDPSICLRGAFLTGSLMAHDCTGNVHLSVDDEFTMTVRAATNIPEGGIIYFNYTNGLQGTYDRRKHLKEGKYFDCNCKRCSDGTEMNTNMSALRCRKCTDGLYISTDPLNGSDRIPWKCTKCNSILKGIVVKTTINLCRDKLKEYSNSKEAETLLEKLSLTLAPQHSIIVELKQNLLSLPNVTSERKIALYKELLSLVKIVEPGISRYRSIIQYKYHNALVDMVNRRYNKNEMKTDDFLRQLKNAEALLMESIKLLFYEPKLSPEGRLAQRAMTDLKVLRGTINDIGKILLLEPRKTDKKKDKRKK